MGPMHRDFPVNEEGDFFNDIENLDELENTELLTLSVGLEPVTSFKFH